MSWPPRFTAAQVRAAVLFVGGLLGVAYEMFTQSGERPTLLVMFAAMMGLPYFTRLDATRPVPPHPPVLEPPTPPTPLPPAPVPDA